MYPKRTHISNVRDLVLNHNHSYVADRLLKPTGLWYSIGIDWLKWCQSEGFWTQFKYLYELNLDSSVLTKGEPNAEKILSIETPAELTVFNRRYTKKTLIGSHCIDWERVQKDYGGIEFATYSKSYLTRDQILMIWYYSLDCAGGCIWNTRLIDSLRLIAQEDGPGKYKSLVSEYSDIDLEKIIG